MGSALGVPHRARPGREERRKPPSSGSGSELLSARMFWITEGSARKAGRGLSNQSVRRVGRRLLKINRIGRPDGVQGGFQNRSSCGLISVSKASLATPRKDFGPPGFWNLAPRLGITRRALNQKQMSSKELLKVIQSYWLAIENGVHYRRDVSFEEERCRAKNR